jgi:hypothetical protein
MIPPDCKPIGHIPPLPRIDLNPSRPIAKAPTDKPFYNPFMGAMSQVTSKAEQDRIWKLIEQTSESP